jgi:hypothetical protein
MALRAASSGLTGSHQFETIFDQRLGAHGKDIELGAADDGLPLQHFHTTKTQSGPSHVLSPCRVRNFDVPATLASER